jgi:hypothetical protein
LAAADGEIKLSQKNRSGGDRLGEWLWDVMLGCCCLQDKVLTATNEIRELAGLSASPPSEAMERTRQLFWQTLQDAQKEIKENPEKYPR